MAGRLKGLHELQDERMARHAKEVALLLNLHGDLIMQGSGFRAES